MVISCLSKKTQKNNGVVGPKQNCDQSAISPMKTVHSASSPDTFCEIFVLHYIHEAAVKPNSPSPESFLLTS